MQTACPKRDEQLLEIARATCRKRTRVLGFNAPYLIADVAMRQLHDLPRAVSGHEAEIIDAMKDAIAGAEKKVGDALRAAGLV